MDPVKGNVTFSAALYGWSFTLRSFAQLYADVWGTPLDPKWVLGGGGYATGSQVGKEGGVTREGQGLAWGGKTEERVASAAKP